MAHRKVPKREFLVVYCEGSKTEPYYLAALARCFGMTGLSVPKTDHTYPIGLVRLAIQALAGRNGADSAAAIFDRDGHDSFDDAIRLARGNAHYGKRLFVAPSIPCFETWLIFHFRRTRSPMDSHQALKTLLNEYPSYDKGSAECMDEFIDRIFTAFDNSVFAKLDAFETNEPNPCSDMHDFIQNACKIKKP
jgi:RloB-like protein